MAVVGKTWLVGVFTKNSLMPSTSVGGTRTLNGQWLHEFRSKEQAEEFCVTQANENHKQVAKLFVATSTFQAEEPRIQQTVF